VYLVVKLRVVPPGSSSTPASTSAKTEDADAAKATAKRDYAFLIDGKKDAEDISDAAAEQDGWAHAPFWPAHRRPGWWLVLADDKSNRVVVPPMKIAEVPFAKKGAQAESGDWRAYKLQFQAPQGVGVYTWKLAIVSDTFVGEEIEHAITVRFWFS
jgi:translocation protein SEC63